MKKSLITAAFVLGTIVANAQTAGNFYIGGTLGFNSSNSTTKIGNVSKENPKSSNYIVMPEVGYFLRNDISIGLAIGIGGNKTVNTNTNPTVKEVENKTTFFGVILYGRKFFPVNDVFSFYAGLNLGMNPGTNTSTTKFNNGDQTTIEETKTSLIGAGLNAGINYRITERVTLMGSFAVLGFTSQTETDYTQNPIEETKTNNFGLNISTYGTPFSIGMYYNLHQ